MPRRKDDPPNMVTINVSIPEQLKVECLVAKDLGLWKNMAESTFIRYLLEMGLRKYQRDYLPGEVPVPMPLHATHQRRDVWVNEALERYDFGVTNGIGSQATIEKRQAEAEEAGYNRMPYQLYRQEYIGKFGTEPPPPPRPMSGPENLVNPIHDKKLG